MTGQSSTQGLEDAAQSPLRALVAGFPGAAAHVWGNHIWLNEFAEAMVGYENDELGSVLAWGQAVHRDDEPRARDAYDSARRAGFPEPVVLTVFRKDEARRLVEFSAYQGMDEEIWVMRDITDARRAEQELRDREQTLQVAVTTAGLGTWEWDVAAGRITGSGTTRRLFGLGDQAGSDAFDAYLDRVVLDDRTRFQEAVERAVRARSTFDIELRVGADHGRHRWLRMHGTVVSEPEGRQPRLIGAIRDIDSYKRLDERLVHAARMESLGQLAGGVAHDFNNLLAVIQGQVEFVADEPGMSDKAVVRLRSVERAVAKGAEMVASLMQLGRSDVAMAEVVNLNDVLGGSVGSLEQVVGEDVTIDLDLAATRPYLKFDEARLSALVLNLATNARDAMPVGGLLSIATHDAPIASGTDCREPFVQLVVEDTGIGMDAETRTRIFEPFFTTKAPGVGTGLGLASVYDAVIDAGGVIDVESTPGVGTKISIFLPRAEPSDRPAELATRTTPPASRGQVIMVVEDDAAILDVTADILRSAGYEVLPALGPHAASEYVADGDKPDLLLTDVVMPEISGPRLAAQLAELIPGMPVLFMSGYTTEMRGGVTVDESQLIRKPFSHDDLLDRVAQLLAEKNAGPRPV